MRKSKQPPDLLLTYCVALDAADMERAEAIWKEAEGDLFLEMEMIALHLRFDSNEEFTGQLLRERKSYEKAHLCF